MLLVGPTDAFMKYIERVLPSLGETGVVMAGIGTLMPGVSTVQETSEEAAQARSTAPTPGQAVSRSACTVRIRSDGPGAPAAARSRSSLGADRSIATICADGKRRARSRLPAPVPAPMSATVSGVPRTCWPTQSSTSSSSGPRISASSSSSSASPSSSCCSGWVWCPAVGCGESCGVMPPR